MLFSCTQAMGFGSARFYQWAGCSAGFEHCYQRRWPQGLYIHLRGRPNFRRCAHAGRGHFGRPRGGVGPSHDRRRRWWFWDSQQPVECACGGNAGSPWGPAGAHACVSPNGSHRPAVGWRGWHVRAKRPCCAEHRCRRSFWVSRREPQQL